MRSHARSWWWMLPVAIASLSLLAFGGTGVVSGKSEGEPIVQRDKARIAGPVILILPRDLSVSYRTERGYTIVDFRGAEAKVKAKRIIEAPFELNLGACGSIQASDGEVEVDNTNGVLLKITVRECKPIPRRPK